MDVKINHDKLKQLLFNYLNSVDELRYAEEHRNWYDSNVKEYFYTYHYEEDIDPDFEFVFAYYNSPSDYEDVVGVNSPYDSSTYPLIEVDTYIYKKIIDLFGETYAPQLLLEWLNNIYGLDAVSISEN